PRPPALAPSNPPGGERGAPRRGDGPSDRDHAVTGATAPVLDPRQSLRVKADELIKVSVPIVAATVTVAAAPHARYAAATGTAADAGPMDALEMELLEREPYLTELDRLLGEAAAGHGHLLFLGGEAGVGKTAFVHRVADSARRTARVFLGACDPMSTPRPL